MTQSALALAAARLRTGGKSLYYDDPAGWARNCIQWPAGQELAPYQAEIMTQLASNSKAAARGPHGLGKTTTNALLVLWFATTRDTAGVDWKIATTAGAWRQLEKYLWPEIHKWAKYIRWDVVGRARFSRQELLSMNLKLHHGAAFAVASDDPQLIEGVHADEVLYIFDESKSIPADVFDAAEGAFSGSGTGALRAYALATSTPGAPSGRFYDIHQRKKGFEDWWVRHVTLEECIAAQRVNQGWAEARASQWGATSGIYANRVLGEFHSSDEDGAIPLAWVELAHERWAVWQENPPPLEPTTVGVDVARSGNDKTSLALYDAPVITELRRAALADTMETTGRVAGLLRSSPPRKAVVDVIGIGAGVVDRLRELDLPVDAFNASTASTKRDRSGELGFTNLRSAAWWHLREMLDPAYEPTLALPPDDLLTGDLTAPTWRVMSGGRIQIEAKDDIRKRLGRSPDDGDAVVMAVWEASSNGADEWTAFMTPAAPPEPEAPPADAWAAARQAAFRAGHYRN